VSAAPGSIPSVTTERLLLRAVEESDLDTYHQRLFADPEVMRYLPGGEPLPRERLDGLVERSQAHWQSHGYGTWVVCELASGELLGQSGLRYLEEIRETEVFYALARAFWGRGLATEAARAAVQFGFDRAGLERIVAYAVPQNVASRRVMDHLGMCFEVETRMWDLDLVRYGLEPVAFRASFQAGPYRFPT
jgi:RimJ/RimL family protein N-acetyltransferase